jgi:nucleoside-diphosphate-sugar epimerase
VIALVRPESNLYRLEGITPLVISQIQSENWGQFLGRSNAEVWISVDWLGVSNTDRNSESQFENVKRLQELCAQVSNIPTVIGTGSQAELGPINDIIFESQCDAPTTLYGEAKVSARNIMQSHFAGSESRFVWARIFSTYGALDSNDWLIPSTIDTLLQGKRMPLTQGEQEWSYLHAYDLARAFQVLAENKSISGIVNVGNPETVRIYDVAAFIGDALERPDLLGFGDVPYRVDQVMKLAPACEKLTAAGWAPEIELSNGITHLINWMSFRSDMSLLRKSGSAIELHLPVRKQK